MKMRPFFEIKTKNNQSDSCGVTCNLVFNLLFLLLEGI